MTDHLPEPDPVANWDQMLAGISEFARLIRGYYEALSAAGFPEDQALALTMQYQASCQQIAAASRDE